MSMNAPREPGTAPIREEPNVAGVKVRPAWPLALYALLVASAGVALYAQRAPVDPVVGRVAPWTFLAFALGFTAYRVALVAARRYSPFKAFFQVFMAALFFMLLLLPGTAPVAAPGLLGHREPAVRALAAKVAGLERDLSTGPALVGLLDDASPEVRAAAHQALVQLNGGADLGPDLAAWKARFR